MANIPEVFNQPGAAFVLLPEGIKFPPIEKKWQKKGHSFQEAVAHKGNIGVMAGNGFIGLDQDDLSAFEGLELPITTTWQTRPGRFGLWFKASDDIPQALAGIGKKADQSQLKLFKNGLPCGEIKIERTYQVIPTSWKLLENGDRADYLLLQDAPPATIGLFRLIKDLQALGITFSSKVKTNGTKEPQSPPAMLQSACKVDRPKKRPTIADVMEFRLKEQYAEAALKGEINTLLNTSEGGRNDQLNASAFSLGQLIAGGYLDENKTATALTEAAESIGLDFEEIEKTIQSGLEAGKLEPRQIPDGQSTRDQSRDLDSEELTEGGNAHRLERIHGDDMRFNHTHKKWLVWDGGRWKADNNGGAARLAEDVVSALYLTAANASDSKERDRIAGFAKSTDSRRGIANMLALAANRLRFALTADDFDKDPWLLGAGEVTVDLKTCEAREPQRSDLITMQAGAVYDRSADCPRWGAFLRRIFADDEELIRYVQRAVGYCLTGSTAEQIFFFCYGIGANGKSVFLAVLRALMGEYAKQADFSTFLVQRNEKVRNDLAALAGARVITATEAEEGGRLSMQVLKSWTGGDPITARFLFGENFTFKPQGKIWLAANTKPAITERNYAAWRRVHLIPFNVTIPPGERNNNLENELLEELPGILNWALDGLRSYLNGGMQTPRAVHQATEEYRKENDSIESFLSECCEFGKLRVCKNSDLYNQYLNFCTMSGLKPLSQHKFSPEMNSRQCISSERNKYGMLWKGVDLKPEWNGCSFDAKATSLSSSSIGVALPSNAYSSLNSPYTRDFTHLTSKATPHSDLNLHQSYTKPGMASLSSGEKGEKSDNLINNLSETSSNSVKASIPSNSDKIRAASIAEYGLNGWADPKKIANHLKLPFEEVEAWLQANYTAYERPGGGIGYRQRRPGEARA